MQNKGFVALIAALLTAICLFYMSFTLVVNHHDNKAQEITQTQGEEAARRYLDSLDNKTVWNIGIMKKTLKECRSLGLGLGLDLKGGMNIVLKVGIDEVFKSLSDHKEETNPAFAEALKKANEETKNGGDYVDAFARNFKAIAGEGKLAEVFATAQMNKVKPNSTDAEVISALRANAQEAVDNAYLVVRARVDQFGVAQPNIQKLDGDLGRIMVELPGVKDRDRDRVSKLLEGSANLEIWETYEVQDVLSYLVEVDRQLADSDNGQKTLAAAADSADTAAVADSAAVAENVTTEDTLTAGQMMAASGAENADAAAQTPADAASHPLFSRLSLFQTNGGCVVGVAKKRDMAIIDSLFASPAAKQILPGDLYLAWDVKGNVSTESGEEFFQLYALRSSKGNHMPAMSGDVITEASDAFNQNSNPVVNMKMHSEGARRWQVLTKNNVGRCVAIVLDGAVYSAPRVNGEIPGGSTEISGHFTVEETKDLANVLKSGKMPAPSTIESYEVVGPSLGAESIQMGVYSCIVAFILLMCYMVMMYGVKAGMVANCALLLNLFFTVGVLTSFQAALTMTGIAGMVLTLGMAVDANVLIYERTKEELLQGKGVREALEAGYSNAFSAIFDSNLTSLITAVILYHFGSGPVRGFATTLGIGICISFFTAVFLTRIVFAYMHKKDKWLNLTFRTSLGDKLSFKNNNFKFMQSWKKSFGVFGALVVISICGIFFRGFSKGIDFSGGRNYVVAFDKTVSADAINDQMEKAFDGQASVIVVGSAGDKIRVSTNYKIDEVGLEVDQEIEQKIYNTLQEAKVIDETVSIADFTNSESNGAHIESSQKVGPTMAKDVTDSAYKAIILSFIAIFIYILIRFRNIAFSVGAIVALMCDIMIVLGAYALLHHIVPFSLDIDQTFVGAILTAIGYSINDKVVVFDRIRENLGLHPTHNRLELFNTSVNSTLNRTVNTSVSTFIVLAVIFIIGLFFSGAASIISFSFAMILGVVFGTFSSMLVAAPIAYLIMGEKKSKKETK